MKEPLIRRVDRDPLLSRGSKKRLNDGRKGRKTMRQLMQGMEESFGALIALWQLLDDGKIEREAEPKRRLKWGINLSEMS
jgi:hypothetical protein